MEQMKVETNEVSSWNKLLEEKVEVCFVQFGVLLL